MDQARARELLQAERARIEAQLRSAQAGPAGEELSDDDDEQADLATDTYQAELDETRRDELNEQLRAVERAEQRLEDGTYGRSVVSGEPIPDERLEVNPAAERTAAEQEAFERGA
jgi:RNA polymerase-binding transcription factor